MTPPEKTKFLIAQTIVYPLSIFLIMSDEIEYNCEHLNISYTSKDNKLTWLLRYKIYYKTREIRFHFRFPEPNKLRDREKTSYPNMIFWLYLEDLKILNAHIYFEPTKHIIYIHHDRHYFSDLVADCVAASKNDPTYPSARAEFEHLMLTNFGVNNGFYYSPASTPSPRTSSPPTQDTT